MTRYVAVCRNWHHDKKRTQTGKLSLASSSTPLPGWLPGFRRAGPSTPLDKSERSSYSVGERADSSIAARICQTERVVGQDIVVEAWMVILWKAEGRPYVGECRVPARWLAESGTGRTLPAIDGESESEPPHVWRKTPRLAHDARVPGHFAFPVSTELSWPPLERVVLGDYINIPSLALPEAHGIFQHRTIHIAAVQEQGIAVVEGPEGCSEPAHDGPVVARLEQNNRVSWNPVSQCAQQIEGTCCSLMEPIGS